MILFLPMRLLSKSQTLIKQNQSNCLITLFSSSQNPSICLRYLQLNNSNTTYNANIAYNLFFYYINTSVLSGFLPLRKSIYFHM